MIGSRGELFQLPGSSLLTAVGLQPLMVDPNEFLSERLIVLMIFTLRYIYNIHMFPDATLYLSVSYERHTIETTGIIVPAQSKQPTVLSGTDSRLMILSISPNNTIIANSAAMQDFGSSPAPGKIVTQPPQVINSDFRGQCYTGHRIRGTHSLSGDSAERIIFYRRTGSHIDLSSFFDVTHKDCMKLFSKLI